MSGGGKLLDQRPADGAGRASDEHDHGFRRSMSAHGAERSPHLRGEEFGLLPGGEVAALVDLVEVREAGVGGLGPAARGSPDLAGERREADRHGRGRRGLAGRLRAGPRVIPVVPGCEAPVPVSQYSVMLSRMWSRVRFPEGCPSTNARAIL